MNDRFYTRNTHTHTHDTIRDGVDIDDSSTYTISDFIRIQGNIRADLVSMFGIVAKEMYEHMLYRSYLEYVTIFIIGSTDQHDP
jgi:hypothetical protein